MFSRINSFDKLKASVYVLNGISSFNSINNAIAVAIYSDGRTALFSKFTEGITSELID